MSESQQAELQHWQARCDEMQVTIDRMRDEKDMWKTTASTQTLLIESQEAELKQLRSMVSRIQVAMSQGLEL
jgi:hypothetical protein